MLVRNQYVGTCSHNDSGIAGVIQNSSSQMTSTFPSSLPQSDQSDLDVGLRLKDNRPIPAFLNIEGQSGLRTNTPLLVTIEYVDCYFVIEHQDFGIFGRGKTSEDALVDFLDYLCADYKAYAEESDDKLDASARELAVRYRKLLSRI